MDLKNLFDTLKDLNENRRLSSESDALIKPFIGALHAFSLRFCDASPTFSSHHDHRYSGGKTIVANFLDEELECSILFPPSKNEWIESLKKGEEFQADLVVFELDNLYQRIVFGYSFHKLENEVEDETNLPINQSEETELVKEIEIDSLQIEKVTVPSVHSLGITPELEADLSPNSEQLENQVEEESALSEISSENFTVLNKEEEVSTIPQSELNKEEIPIEPIEVNEDVKLEILEQIKKTPPDRISGEEEVKGEYDSNDIERILDKRYEHGSGSLTSGEKEALLQAVEEETPLAEISSGEEVKREYDFNDIEHILDKRYEHGSGSLTSEEEELLMRSQRRSNSARRVIRQVEQEELGKKTSPRGISFYFGCFGLIVGYILISTGSFLPAFVTLFVSCLIVTPSIEQMKIIKPLTKQGKDGVRVDNRELGKKNSTESEIVLSIGKRLTFGIIFIIAGYNFMDSSSSVLSFVVLMISCVILTPLVKKMLDTFLDQFPTDSR